MAPVRRWMSTGSACGNDRISGSDALSSPVCVESLIQSLGVSHAHRPYARRHRRLVVGVGLLHRSLLRRPPRPRSRHRSPARSRVSASRFRAHRRCRSSTGQAPAVFQRGLDHPGQQQVHHAGQLLFTGLVITQSTKYRVYAARAKVGGKVRGSITTRTLTVAYGGTNQTVKIETLPGIGQISPDARRGFRRTALRVTSAPRSHPHDPAVVSRYRVLA